MDKIVGVNDLIMLDKVEEASVVGNLKTRFEKNIIYTSIGDVVISVNPYKTLDIYNKKTIAAYQGRNPFELPPHIFSVADTAFHYMRDRGTDQCIIITGESGSGKTEGSKRIMQYISAIADSKVEKIKEQLLDSNPLLEAWGNAKTLRNDNSSRFGKYMDLQFDYKSQPVGGVITVYLLEKSRVTNTALGGRNFHIFYQLLKGADDGLKKKLKLTGNTKDYLYLSQSKCDTIQGVDDKKGFLEVTTAMKSLGISNEVQTSLFETLAAILHLGNFTFKAAGDGSAVSDAALAKTTADLLGIPADVLCTILTSRKLKEKGGPEIKMPLDVAKANYTRESLAKALYGNMFVWFVAQINLIINNAETKEGKRRVIGVLDIYGFEVLQTNSFEQLCINYTNEKLQQLFIEQTLKSEQEEYAREGIKWTHIDYFNNQIICDLIETKKGGILALLDEECLRPGQVSDLTFLAKMDANVLKHAHYDSKVKTQKDKSLLNNDFRLKHYAGDVTYAVDGFLDKNNDTLYKEIKQALNGSKSKMIRELFPDAGKDDLKRPETLGTQFKASIQLLIQNLSLKTPHYVRCIKPNTNKSSTEFDTDLCQHQSRYLGLLESVRVRRAGFCYRQKYELFFPRFKMLSAKTWPSFKGKDIDGTLKIMETFGVPKAEFQTGKTKLFIKSPPTIFDLEAKRNVWKDKTGAPLIQKMWKGHVQRQRFLKLRAALLVVQSLVRMFLAKRLYKRIKVMRGTAIKVFAAKAGYQKSIPFLFTKSDHANLAKSLGSALDGPILFSLPVLKYHRSNLKARAMNMVLTTKSLSLVTNDPAKPVLRQRIALEALTFIGMSPFADSVLVCTFKDQKKGKGDMMVQLVGGGKERLVEFVTWAITNSPAKTSIQESIQASFKGKVSTVKFAQDPAVRDVVRKKDGDNFLISIPTA